MIRFSRMFRREHGGRFGTGTVGFSDCTFVQWDSKNEGRHAIQAAAGTVLVRGCEFRQDKPQIESKQFEDTQTIGGRTVSYIRANRVVNYQSNWNTLEGVELKIYRLNGLTYELSCPTAEYNSVTKEANAKGGVQVVSSDGVNIQTAEITTAKREKVLAVPVQAVVVREVNKEGKVVDPESGPGAEAQGNTVTTVSREKGQEKDGVFVVQGDKAVFTPVKTGIMGETDIEISQGITDGQEIVTGSYRTLRNLKDQARLKVETKGKKS